MPPLVLTGNMHVHTKERALLVCTDIYVSGDIGYYSNEVLALLSWRCSVVKQFHGKAEIFVMVSLFELSSDWTIIQYKIKPSNRMMPT
ncbi:hypothetical protein CDAR_556691 [Caerostris darwini]|uniref:Uncharacterized protein n=1 Tax=Caerostris darwini TaxID=1538125 RepID=A0AAV4WN36_9ARAC|nr:hypothetical protein CDAR_556691 [Caerostris darwini]